MVGGTSLQFLAADSFDVVHAHSVFTHTPLDVIAAYLDEVHRVLRPGGFFDFTYHHTDGESWSLLDEDYHYPTELLLDMARQAGFEAHRLTEWVYVQPKIRLRKPATNGQAH